MRTRYPYDFWTDVIWFCAMVAFMIGVFCTSFAAFLVFTPAASPAAALTVLLVAAAAILISVLFTIWWCNRKFVS